MYFGELVPFLKFLLVGFGCFSKVGILYFRGNNKPY